MDNMTKSERLQRLLDRYDFDALSELKKESPEQYQESVDEILSELDLLKKKKSRLENMV